VNAASLLIGAGVFAFWGYLPQFLELSASAGGSGLTVRDAGLMLVPMLIGMSGVGFATGALNRILSLRTLLVIGALLMGASGASAALAHSSPWQLALGRRLRHRLRAGLRGVGRHRRPERACLGHRRRDRREREPPHDRIRDRLGGDRRDRVRLGSARNRIRLRHRMGARRRRHDPRRRDRLGGAHSPPRHDIGDRAPRARRGLNRRSGDSR
jgi:hypothetical protein